MTSIKQSLAFMGFGIQGDDDDDDDDNALVKKNRILRDISTTYLSLEDKAKHKQKRHQSMI